MSLTPQDIQRSFKERFRGYDPDEVDEFLARIADRVVSLQDERDQAVERLREVEQSGGGSGNGALESERLLKRTLIAAEQTADRVVSEAESEAERVVGEARRRADELLASARSAADREWREARDGADRVRRAVAHLRAFRDDYTERVRSAIAEQLAVLDRVGDLPEIPASVERLGTLSIEEPQRLAMDTGEPDQMRRTRPSPAAQAGRTSADEDTSPPRRSAWNAKAESEAEQRSGSWTGVWGASQRPAPRGQGEGDDVAAHRAGRRPQRARNEGENRDTA